MRFSKSLHFEVYSSLICLILPFFSLVMFGLACVWCLLIAAFLHFPCTCISRTCGALLESPMPSRWSVRVADSKLTSRILHLSRVDANSLVLINLLYRGCAVQHKLLGRCFHTLTPRYPGWLDFTDFVRDNGVSGTTGQASVQGNLEFIEIHTD